MWISHKHADHMLGLPGILHACTAAKPPLLVSHVVQGHVNSPCLDANMCHCICTCEPCKQCTSHMHPMLLAVSCLPALPKPPLEWQTKYFRLASFLTTACFKCCDAISMSVTHTCEAHLLAKLSNSLERSKSDTSDHVIADHAGHWPSRSCQVADRHCSFSAAALQLHTLQPAEQDESAGAGQHTGLCRYMIQSFILNDGAWVHTQCC